MWLVGQGQLNEETKFVLDKFNLERPMLITDVRPQVKDIAIKRTLRLKAIFRLKLLGMICKKNRRLPWR